MTIEPSPSENRRQHGQWLSLNLARAGASARRLVDPVLAVIFPSRCAGCARLLERTGLSPLCEACWAGLPRLLPRPCRCGLPLLPERSTCGACAGDAPLLAAGASLGPYEGSLRLVLHELKYSGRRGAAERLAAVLLAEPLVLRLLETSELVIPVPLHPRRLRQRGFNQSALLARALARNGSVRFCGDALVRQRDTPPQTGLCAADRRSNVRDAFVVRRRAAVAGRVVTLVDDVTTTGATALACARALARAGAAEVRLLTAARA